MVDRTSCTSFEPTVNSRPPHPREVMFVYIRTAFSLRSACVFMRLPWNYNMFGFGKYCRKNISSRCVIAVSREAWTATSMVPQYHDRIAVMSFITFWPCFAKWRSCFSLLLLHIINFFLFFFFSKTYCFSIYYVHWKVPAAWRIQYVRIHEKWIHNLILSFLEIKQDNRMLRISNYCNFLLSFSIEIGW